MTYLAVHSTPIELPALRHLPGLYEPVSAATHLLGAVAFTFAGLVLLRRGGRGEPARLAFLGTFVASGVFLMLASGIYHAATGGGPTRAVMLRLDHAAIFVLIAGTFTPVHGLLFRGPLRWGPLALVWAAAAAGIAVNVLRTDLPPEWVELTCYLAMGWLGVASGVLVWRRRGFRAVRPLLWGGLAYSVGAIADFVRRPILVTGYVHAHELFHVAVLVGAAFHFAFVWRVAVAPANEGRAGRPFVVRSDDRESVTCQ
jgi:channel protein (hemolysin III family)